MTSDFVAFLPPPGNDIKHYNRCLPPADQNGSVNQTFRDAMYVREEVFVKEQHVPLDRELDEQDPFCFHWVVYASVNDPSKGDAAPVVQKGFGTQPAAPIEPTATTSLEKSVDKGIRSRSGSTAINLPVGVIRLVPPPHAACRIPHITFSTTAAAAQDTITTDNEPNTYPHPTAFPNERYIKLGRLATLPAYRGLGLSRLLVNAALQHARKHADAFGLPRVEGVALEQARLRQQQQHQKERQKEQSEHSEHPELQELQEGELAGQWRGLVYVHAQKERTMELWRRYGFVLDEGMGEWDEEGMMHVGMYKRLQLEDA